MSYVFRDENDKKVIPVLLMCCEIRGIKFKELITEYKDNERIKKVIDILANEESYMTRLNGRTVLYDWERKDRDIIKPAFSSKDCEEQNSFYVKEILKLDEVYRDEFNNVSMYELEQKVSKSLSKAKVNLGLLGKDNENKRIINIAASEEKEKLEYYLLTIKEYINKDAHNYRNNYEFKDKRNQANDMIEYISSNIL